jgi:hypothetical protein
MGSRILFYAGPQDMNELNAFVRSLDLYLVPPSPALEYSDDETELGRCFISPVPKEELRTWGHKTAWYQDTLDPIISFERSIYQGSFIRPGDIYWNNDVRSLAVQTKPIFQKIARWVRKNWPKPQGHDWHFGPEAKHLVFKEGVKATSMVPGVTLNGVSVVPDC